MFVKKTQKERRGSYIRHNIFVNKYKGLYPGGLVTRGGYNVGFYGSLKSVFEEYFFFSKVQ